MEPLFKASPGEPIRAEHWNQLQLKLLAAMDEIRSELGRVSEQVASKLTAAQSARAEIKSAVLDELRPWLEQALATAKPELLDSAKQANRQTLNDLLRTIQELRERVDQLSDAARQSAPKAPYASTAVGEPIPEKTASHKPAPAEPAPVAPKGAVLAFQGAHFDGPCTEPLAPRRFVRAELPGMEKFGSFSIGDDLMVALDYEDECGALCQQLRGLCANLQDKLPMARVSEMRIVGQEVMIYFDDKFKGESQALRVGTYGKAQLGPLYRQITSLKVPEGLVISLFDGDDCSGASLVLSSDCSSLVEAGWNDRALAVRVARHEVMTYELGGYNMASDRPVASAGMLALSPGRYRSAELAELTNKISSLRVPEGLAAYLYQGNNFNLAAPDNAFQIVTRDCDNLMIYDFNDKVGSVRVERFLVTLFDQTHYQGLRQALLCQERPYAGRALAVRSVLSIEIPAGIYLTVTDANKNRKTLTADTPDLGELGLKEPWAEVSVARLEAVLYEQPGYKGKELRLLAGSYTEKALGELNNRIGSIRLPPERLLQLSLFEDGSFSVPLGVIRESQENLGTAFQGVSSLRIMANRR